MIVKHLNDKFKFIRMIECRLLFIQAKRMYVVGGVGRMTKECMICGEDVSGHHVHTEKTSVHRECLETAI